MLKKRNLLLTALLLLLTVLLLVASCSSEKTTEQATKETTRQTTTDNTATGEITRLTIAQFNADGEKYEGKLVEVEGTVDHVCSHSGKRMFIVGENPQDRVKIEAGDLGTFDMALQGSKVRVVAVGTVMKIDSAFLDNKAKEINAEESHENHSENHSGEQQEQQEQQEKGHGGHDHEHDNALAQIIELRRQLAESGKGYLAFCGLEAKSFEEIH
ncbi:hypothetical protein CSA17_06715 [bacterium DOLJORAL78_65_58]|nr:MAG: hypothetical protein CSB20_02775 [bacterium DOLZORAL124_64_63]PIE75575.1 MAG: hypothetical protein CSA17_06715 [bacterium DOLJORAL78_65_58]